MSIIQKNLGHVSSPDETLPEFINPNTDPRIGLEVESHFVDSTLKAATPDSFYELARRVEGKTSISLEAASTLFEVKNDIPYAPGPANAEKTADDLITALTIAESEIKEMSHLIAPHSILPWSNFEDLAKTHIHKGPNPRPTAFIDFFMAHNPARARNFITVAGQQSSLTHKTPEDTLRYFNRLAHLTPLLTSVMSTVPPYAVLDNGEFGAVKTNLSLSRRLQTGGGPQNAFPGLLQSSAINSDEAQGFMERWNDHVWDTPLFCYYDPSGEDEFTRLRHFEPAGKMVSFRDLPERLQTRENFNMASSIQYGLITMSHIPASETTPDRRRVEARLYDAGSANQIRTVSSLTHALAFNGEFGERVDHFIKQRGYKDLGTPSASVPKVTEALDYISRVSFNSLEELPYGDGSVYEAAKAFSADVIKPMLEDFPDLAALARQCERGTSPALYFRNAVINADDFAQLTKDRGLIYHDYKDSPELSVF